VEVPANWLIEMLSAFTTFEADIVFGRSYPIWLAGPPMWYAPVFAGRFAIIDYGPTPFIARADHPFFGLNVGFKRSAVEAVGSFREDLGYVGNSRGGGEDTDVFHRALACGLRIAYVAATRAKDLLVVAAARLASG
jgi:hypothetical protein